ncbi:MAG: DUF3052 domain-containing protein [Candidatus Eremiobacter antarcticus]
MPRGHTAYSERPLIDNLGIKPHTDIAIFNAPKKVDAAFGQLPAGVTRRASLRGPLDFIHFFTASRQALQRKFAALKAALAKDGTLWISWPKTTSGVRTDLNENIVREIGLGNGLVDVKVCAVDEVWSGLKFVYRLSER